MPTVSQLIRLGRTYIYERKSPARLSVYPLRDFSEALGNGHLRAHLYFDND